MIEQYFSSPKSLQRFNVGPLKLHIKKFTEFLSKQGYARYTVKAKIVLVSALSHWLHQQHIEIKELDEQKIVEFFRDREKRIKINRGELYTLNVFLKQLRESQVIPSITPAVDDSPLHRIESRYRRYLLQERGLTQSTLTDYLPIIRLFLTEQFGTETILFTKLCPRDITQFILRHSKTCVPSRVQLMATALRSFLRFLLQCGDINTNLAASIPKFTNWRLARIPKFLEPEQVECLLVSCNQDTPGGRRDYAVLLLLARLGLRAGEIANMELNDITWETGEIMVRGKSFRQDRLPIPPDVGEALVNYLCYDRPHCSSRKIFIRMKAPHQGFSSSVAICNIVQRALTRAGVQSKYKGAHLLRHSLATQMLRRGASMADIGEILRHQFPNTTEIYAKVDFVALNALAQPWPGGEI